MNCRRCGCEIPDGMNFCPQCGMDQRIQTFESGNTSGAVQPKKAIGEYMPSDLHLKPPKKKKHPLRVAGIIVVLLIVISALGRGRRQKNVPSVSSSYSNQQDQGVSGQETAGAENTIPEATANNTQNVSGQEAAVTPEMQVQPTEMPQAAETPAATEAPAEEEGHIVDTELVTPEFKEMMDSYEEWFDSYIEFMNSYNETDDPMAMLQKYTEFMSQYTEVMNKMGAIDQKELSPADSAYYLEVTARIYQKLATVSMN